MGKASIEGSVSPYTFKGVLAALAVNTVEIANALHRIAAALELDRPIPAGTREESPSTSSQDRTGPVSIRPAGSSGVSQEGGAE